MWADDEIGWRICRSSLARMALTLGWSSGFASGKMPQVATSGTLSF